MSPRVSLVLAVWIAGCTLSPLEPDASVQLPGVPKGAVLDAEGRLLVVHESDAQCCRLTGYDPTLSAPLFDVGGGPGVPRTTSDRTWFTLRTAVTALNPASIDGSEVLWSTSLQAPMVAVGPAAGLSDGTLVVAVNDDAPDLGTNGVNAQLQAVGRLGELQWRTSLGGAFAGGMRVGPDDTVYVATTPAPDIAEPTVLHAVSATGEVVWSDDAGGIPVLPLDDGVLVARGGVLVRLDSGAEEVWTSSAPIAPTPVDARGEPTATLADLSPSQVWVTAPGRVTAVDLATGTPALTFDETCGPLVAGQDLGMWGFCETTDAGRIALSRIGGLELQRRSLPIAGRAVGAPVITRVSDGVGASIAYAVLTGPADAPDPRLVRYPGVTNVAPDAPWGEPYGAGNTGAR